MTSKEWIQKCSASHPEGPWCISTYRYRQLLDAAREGTDILDIICAAYNHGFQRGRKYEAKTHTRSLPSAQEGW